VIFAKKTTQLGTLNDGQQQGTKPGKVVNCHQLSGAVQMHRLTIQLNKMNSPPHTKTIVSHHHHQQQQHVDKKYGECGDGAKMRRPSWPWVDACDRGGASLPRGDGAGAVAGGGNAGA